MPNPSNLITAISSAIACSIFPALASAANYDFLQDTDWTADTLVFQGDAGTLRVSAHNNGPLPSYIRADGTSGGTAALGLLVCTVSGGKPAINSGSYCGDGTDQIGIDSTDYIESVVFSFENQVSLTSASFTDGLWGRGAAFNLYVDGQLVLDDETIFSTVLFDNLIGTEFEVQAAGEMNDWFKMSALTADVAEVPVPAAAWLFLSAFGGLTIVKRARKNPN